MLDLKAASVADLEFSKWKGADTAIAVEAECVFQIGMSGVRGTPFVIRDGNFLPRFDVTDCMDDFKPCVAIPAIVSVWKTAVINEADGGIDATDHGVGTAGQSVGLHNTAERVFAWKIVMK